MDPITNLHIDSTSLVDGFTVIDFSFTKPTGTVGGYYLYISSTGSSFELLDGKTDSSHMKESDISTSDDYYGNTHFIYSFTSTGYDGKLVYFYITAVSTLLEESVPSDIISVITYPEQPTTPAAIYDGYEIDVSWSAIDFSNSRNSEFLYYSIYRSGITELFNTTIGTTDLGTSSVLYNTSFNVGKLIWIFDIFKRSQWFGEVTTEGELDLTSIKRTNYSDVSTTITLDNLRVFLDNETDVLLGTSTSTGYIDTSFTTGNYYFYKVASSVSDKNSNYSTVPVFACTISFAYPYLRSVFNSDTTLLSNEEWSEIKKTLIDKNYYDKTAYAIPYSAVETFNFKGYLGVSRFWLDVFVNGEYSFSVVTGDYGEFEFNYLFPKGETLLQFQGRDQRTNTYFSRLSGTTSVRTLNIYTLFSILGNQFKKFNDELLLQQQDVSIEQARYSSYTERYQPLIELYKTGDEDSTKFSDLSYEIFKMFEFVGYDEAMTMLLDGLSAAEPTIDHYKVYYNNRLYRTARTGLTFTPRYIDRYSEAETGLNRSKYYYGVTSKSYIGEETTASTLLVDDRYWPVYKRNNVIFWDYSQGVAYYNVYRGTSTSELYYLTTVSGNVFVDTGMITEDTSKTPPLYNFTDYEAPENVRHYIDVDYTNFNIFFHNRNYLQVIIFAVDDQEIPTYQTDRLLFYLNKIVPPELKYTVAVAYDTSLQVLYPTAQTVDLSNPPARTARYNFSYYDGIEVYG